MWTGLQIAIVVLEAFRWKYINLELATQIYCSDDFNLSRRPCQSLYVCIKCSPNPLVSQLASQSNNISSTMNWILVPFHELDTTRGKRCIKITTLQHLLHEITGPICRNACSADHNLQRTSRKDTFLELTPWMLRGAAISRRAAQSSIFIRTSGH